MQKRAIGDVSIVSKPWPAQEDKPILSARRFTGKLPGKRLLISAMSNVIADEYVAVKDDCRLSRKLTDLISPLVIKHEIAESETHMVTLDFDIPTIQRSVGSAKPKFAPFTISNLVKVPVGGLFAHRDEGFETEPLL